LQYFAIRNLHTFIQNSKLPVHMVNFIHDELVLEVREDHVDEISQRLVSAMTDSFVTLFKDYAPESLSASLVEVGVGSTYAEAK
jgi:DNA polymerase I-like protein with 3'-5' exonuclease and polymerase domains